MFQFVVVWTNYFLQCVMSSNANMFLVTVGMQLWNSFYSSGGVQQYVYSTWLLVYYFQSCR
ncbi:hypothetical protein KDI_41300 [Dictyobacter arantiisoli]|uniref:Uncharacterized protein n=1 Tax=Dictyobacter arantiisoli TaxID=2014874 RepID=A0A5A5THE5_9CHLR|nr:hypothetical protein KDI_41300 [Dictyobacter arantiisoli]